MSLLNLLNSEKNVFKIFTTTNPYNKYEYITQLENANRTVSVSFALNTFMLILNLKFLLGMFLCDVIFL